MTTKRKRSKKYKKNNSYIVKWSRSHRELEPKSRLRRKWKRNGSSNKANRVCFNCRIPAHNHCQKCGKKSVTIYFEVPPKRAKSRWKWIEKWLKESQAIRRENSGIYFNNRGKKFMFDMGVYTVKRNMTKWN